MKAQSSLGIAAAVLLASMSASAANLVTRGGTSQVPTYDGRVYYVKPSGTTCPDGFTCFCNTGTLCTLPGTGTITGTVVIDRSGVTLDCQNRIIQPPRYANSSQQCTSTSQCGQHSSGNPMHACVNGYCQLGGLAGINVGGPFDVDDGSININVNATGHVQDVEVTNCIVRNHYAGYRVQGSEGEDGLDHSYVNNSEFRTNHIGVRMHSTDSSAAWSNYVHDNEGGLDLSYNWAMQVAFNTVNFNHSRQVEFYGMGGTNRWLIFVGNVVESTPTVNPVFGWVNVNVSSLEAAARPCITQLDECDMLIDGNEIYADNGRPELVLWGASSSVHPTVKLTDNLLSVNGASQDVSAINIISRCWDKGNVCYHNGGGPASCTPTTRFAPGACWF